MKKLVLLLLFTLITIRVGFAQNFYEVNWTSGSITYTGFLVFYDDNDSFMRVQYTYSGIHKIAEFKCYGKNFEENNVEGYLLDGRDASMIKGQTTYSADNFIFVKQDGQYKGKPFHIDDRGLENNPKKENLQNVNYWKQVDSKDFTAEYIDDFFLPSESMYGKLLGLKSTGTYTTSTANVTTDAVYTAGTEYKISALNTGGSVWGVIMSKSTGISSQVYEANSKFPEDFIGAKWDDSYRINALGYTDGRWAVSMGKNTGYTAQSWKTNEKFPTDWVKEKWDAGQSITEVTYGNNLWGVVMSKGSGYGVQSWKTSVAYPEDWIKEKWDDSYRITSMAYGDGMWATVMTKESGITAQAWKTLESYPNDWITEKWDEGYYITSVTYGDNKWAVVMSKGKGYTRQSWKKSSTGFPSEWISSKWNNTQPATTTTTTTVAAAEPAKMHLVVVANTAISDIGTSCVIDRNSIVREMETIADELDIPIKKTIIDERNLTKENVRVALSSLNPGKNDIVIFMYSGHGYRWSNQTSSYPNMDLRYSNYQSISESTNYNLEDVYYTITGKGARLNIVMSDCCNSDIGVTKRGGQSSLAGRDFTQGQIARLQKLFLNAKGNIIASAAKPNQTSCGNPYDGGYFTSSFLASIHKETSQLASGEPKWNSILDRAINNALYKTQNLNGCAAQNGIYYSTVTY